MPIPATAQGLVRSNARFYRYVPIPQHAALRSKQPTVFRPRRCPGARWRPGHRRMLTLTHRSERCPPRGETRYRACRWPPAHMRKGQSYALAQPIAVADGACCETVASSAVTPHSRSRCSTPASRFLGAPPRVMDSDPAATAYTQSHAALRCPVAEPAAGNPSAAFTASENAASANASDLRSRPRPPSCTRSTDSASPSSRGGGRNGGRTRAG